MTYTEKRIAKKMAENPEYRAAFQEEEALLAKEQEHRRELMSLISEMRKAQHLSQQQLAKRLNVSQARVSQMEGGREPLSVDSLLQMIEVLRGSIVILTQDEVKSFGLQERLVAKGDVVRKAIEVRTNSRRAGKAKVHAHKGAETV